MLNHTFRLLFVVAGVAFFISGLPILFAAEKEKIVVINRPDGSQVVYVNTPSTLNSYEVKPADNKIKESKVTEKR